MLPFREEVRPAIPYRRLLQVAEARHDHSIAVFPYLALAAALLLGLVIIINIHQVLMNCAVPAAHEVVVHLCFRSLGVGSGWLLLRYEAIDNENWWAVGHLVVDAIFRSRVET